MSQLRVGSHSLSPNLHHAAGPIYPWLFLCSVAVRDRITDGVADHSADHYQPHDLKPDHGANNQPADIGEHGEFVPWRV